MLALTYEAYTGSQDEITLELLPCEMKLILTEPDVVTGSGQNVFLGLGNELKIALLSAFPYVSMTFKNIRRIILRVRPVACLKEMLPAL